MFIKIYFRLRSGSSSQNNFGSTGSATLHICALTINIAEPGPEEHPDPDTFIDVSWSSVALSYFKSCSVELQSCGTESYLEVWIRNSNFFRFPNMIQSKYFEKKLSSVNIKTFYIWVPVLILNTNIKELGQDPDQGQGRIYASLERYDNLNLPPSPPRPSLGGSS